MPDPHAALPHALGRSARHPVPGRGVTMAPIHDAAVAGDLQKVKDIADADPSAVHATDEVSRP